MIPIRNKDTPEITCFVLSVHVIIKGDIYEEKLLFSLITQQEHQGAQLTAEVLLQ